MAMKVHAQQGRSRASRETRHAHAGAAGVLVAGILLGLLPLRSGATLFRYGIDLSGDNESPPVASPGSGSGEVVYDDVAHTLAINMSFSGLVGGTTAAHIHSPTVTPFTSTAGVASMTPSFSGFPLGVTSGTFSNAFDLTLTSSFSASFVTANGGTAAGAEAALAAQMLAGKAYFNIHTSFSAGGEIRSFLILKPEISPLVPTAAGQFSFTMTSGAFYRVQATTNPVVSTGWIDLTTMLTNRTTGSVSYADTNAAAYRTRTYRLRSP
jgi:hypothetical protein